MVVRHRRIRGNQKTKENEKATKTAVTEECRQTMIRNNEKGVEDAGKCERRTEKREMGRGNARMP